MGVTSLQRTMRRLDSERRKLFLKSGSKQKIYEVYNKIDNTDEKLRDVADNATRYGQLTIRLRQVNDALEELAETRRQIQSRYHHQLNLKNAWDDWNELETAKQELAELLVIDNFPVNGVVRLEKLEEIVRAAQRELDSANRRVTDAKPKTQIDLVHEEILNYSSNIQRLQNERTAFENAVKDLPERQAELEVRKKALISALKDLGPDWDEARLEEFNLSIAVRQQIDEYRERLRKADAAHAHHITILEQDKTSLEEAQDAENNTGLALESSVKPNLCIEQIQGQRSILRAARSQLSDIKQHQQNLQNQEIQLEGLDITVSPTSKFDWSRAVGAVCFAIGIGLIVGGLVLGAAALVLGVIAGIALSVAAIFLLMSGRLRPAANVESPVAGAIRDSIRRTQDMIQDLQSKLLQKAEPLGLDQIDEESLLASQTSIDQEESMLREQNHRIEALENAKGLSKRRQSRVEDSTLAVVNARRKYDKTQQEWQDWLRSRGLLDTFTPDAAEVLQSQFKLGRDRLEVVRDWQKRIETIKKFIDEYVEVLEPLATTFGVSFYRNDGRSVVSAADRLIGLLDDTREKIRQRTEAESELKDAESLLVERKIQLKKAEEQLNQLLRLGRAVDAETFRERSEIADRRTRLKEKAKASIVRLQRISGPGEPLAGLKVALAKTDYRSIVDRETHLGEEQNTLDVRINELSSEHGSINTQLNGLINEEKSSQFRMDRNVLLEQMKNHAHEWNRLTLAQQLLDMARQKFEKERQPGVIRHAESFFIKITEGEYTQVYAPLGEQTITVTDTKRRTKHPSELSRGTREQLFLSLRFGLIRELGLLTEPLPVVVDEVLVNFDPDRALRAAIAFTELSHTNQILVFTCHPIIVDLFNRAASEIGVEQPEIAIIG